MRTSQEIAEDNDLFRSTLISTHRHKIVLTEGVVALREKNKAAFLNLLSLIRNFKHFDDDNDPWGEHDFGRVELDGNAYFWKLDYYSSDWQTGADPKDGKTYILLTIMRADEY